MYVHADSHFSLVIVHGQEIWNKKTATKINKPNDEEKQTNKLIQL